MQLGFCANGSLGIVVSASEAGNEQGLLLGSRYATYRKMGTLSEAADDVG